MNLPKHIHRRMNEQVLWTLVDYAIKHSLNQAEQISLLTNILSNWKSEHILKFEMLFWKLIEKANTSELQAAACILHPTPETSLFLHFQSWLILQGQTTFKKTLADPEYLATLPQVQLTQTDYQCQALIEVPQKAFLLKNGQVSHIKHIVKSTPIPTEFWTNKQLLIDQLPILCQKMGWGNEVFEGQWLTDDLRPMAREGKVPTNFVQ